MTPRTIRRLRRPIRWPDPDAVGLEGGRSYRDDLALRAAWERGPRAHLYGRWVYP